MINFASNIIRRHLPKLMQDYNISYLGIFGSIISHIQEPIVTSVIAVTKNTLGLF